MPKLWPWTIIAAIFLTSLLWQWGTWQRYLFVDGTFWVSRAEHVAHDITHGPLYFYSPRHAGHPGLPPLLGAAAWHAFGFTMADSLRLSVSALQAVLITVAVILAYKLRPDTWWAFTVAGMLWLYRLYEDSNPADTIMFSLTVIIFLLLLWHIEKPKTSLPVSFSLAAALGAALATRIHLALPVAGICLLALFFFSGLKRTFFIAAVAAVMMYALNPYLWYAPQLYLRPTLIGEFHYVTTTSTPSAPITVADVIRYSPLSFLAITWAAVILFSKKIPTSLPRRFLVVLLAVTTVWLGLLFISRIESRRYYFPLIATWEILFPLFVMEAGTAVAKAKGIQLRGQHVMNFITQSLLVVYTSHLFL